MYFHLFVVLAVTWIQLLRAEDVCTASPPSFAAPGRRISEQKCREYNWERKKADKCLPPATESDNTLYPYLGAIRYKLNNSRLIESIHCNAVLISPKFAVTTVHCAQGRQSIVPAIVRFGIKNFNDTQGSKIDAKIVRSIAHPKYQYPRLSYDIGLMELEGVALSRSVMPACLWLNPEVKVNDIVKVPAWGKTSKADDRFVIVREMKVKFVDTETCSRHFNKYLNKRELSRIEDHHICVDDSLTDFPLIVGTAGAPIVTDERLDESADVMPYAHGLASFGINNRAGISVYTKIPSFLDWIESITLTPFNDKQTNSRHLVRAEDVCTASPPSFSAPGLRISEQKCREYNWERKKANKCLPPATESENTVYSYLGMIGYTSDDQPNFMFTCHAVLVSPKFAVTAAHCLQNRRLVPGIVRFGIKNLDDTQGSKIDAKIVRIIVHPKNQRPKLSYDIALMELEGVTLSRSVMPACLWSNPEVKVNDIVKVPAWAPIIRVDQPHIVKEMKVKLVDYEKCKQRYIHFFSHGRISSNEDLICADESITDSAITEGVSGAPIVTDERLDESADVMPYAHGLSSFGMKFQAGISVYTKIPSFLDWIESIVWQ